MLCFRSMPNESHVRIDEGIKKGPRKTKRTRRKTLPKAPRPDTMALRPLRELDEVTRLHVAATVLEAYSNGQQVAEIAPQFGVSDVTIYALLLRDHQDTWKDVQTARALARLERSTAELDSAPDALSLARARETLRGAQWELERLLNRLYGPKQEVTHTGTVTVTHALQAISERRQARVAGTQQDQPIIDVAPEQQLLDGQ